MSREQELEQMVAALSHRVHLLHETLCNAPEDYDESCARETRQLLADTQLVSPASVSAASTDASVVAVEAQVAALREALQPFAEFAPSLEGRFGREVVTPHGAKIGHPGPVLLVMHIRRAHEALSDTQAGAAAHDAALVAREREACAVYIAGSSDLILPMVRESMGEHPMWSSPGFSVWMTEFVRAVGAAFADITRGTPLPKSLDAPMDEARARGEDPK